MADFSLEQSNVCGSPQNLVVLGPPGSGKGAFSAKLCSLNVERASMGAFFRVESTRDARLGSAYATALGKGKLVSDELTLPVIRRWFFGRRASRGFLLDGFPRNLLQAKVLSEWCDVRRERLSACLYLDIPREEAFRRIMRRMVCDKDGSAYDPDDSPPLIEGRCDLCGGPLGRPGYGTEEVFERRWSSFQEKSGPVAAYYRDQGLLLDVNVSKPFNEIYEETYGMLTGLSLT